MIERLPADVSEVLALVLDQDDPVHAALRAQVPHLRVTGRCGCGCGTADLALDTRSVEPAPVGVGRFVAAEAVLTTETGECPGKVLVFTEDGYLSWLEVCSWSDDIEVDLAARAPGCGPATAPDLHPGRGGHTGPAPGHRP
ncbi:hypothetical protein ACFC8F_27165 [Streptomyces hydrogenans]|uniref:hypothetical protein n=1 Tax=Streptomyces hydrogenans TaxID=1873719 RepID=UPI0035E24F1D